MEIKKLSQASGFDPQKYVAEELIEGTQSNVRVIRLAPGIALPPHKHGVSDLMLYVVEGEASLETDSGELEFVEGDIAYISSEEELRVSNQGTVGVTLLAFLAPQFPPR
jgi:quercetin dioxygenase-like cupin family protein